MTLVCEWTFFPGSVRCYSQQQSISELFELEPLDALPPQMNEHPGFGKHTVEVSITELLVEAIIFGAVC